jgi:hypothetical protein
MLFAAAGFSGSVWPLLVGHRNPLPGQNVTVRPLLSRRQHS